MRYKTLQERKEDYALKFVPEFAREWKLSSLLGVSLASATAIYFFLLGGQAIQTFGTACLIKAVIIVTLIGGSIGFILAIVAAETGLDIDLISSSSCIGYRGASFTSLIYAISFVIFFAIEGSMIVEAIHTVIPIIPTWILNIFVCSLFVILTWYGMSSMNYVMWVSLPIYLAILIYSISTIHKLPSLDPNFLNYQSNNPINLQGGPPLLQLIIMFLSPMISCSLVAADIGRFIPKKKKIAGALLISYFSNSIIYIVACLLGAWFSFKIKQIDPGVYFPQMLGGLGLTFILISQIRINTLNTYSGSLAFTTFFSRGMNYNPGRQYWVLFLAVVALILMFSNILNHIILIFAFLSIFMTSWISVILADIILNRTLFNIDSHNFPIQRGEIPDYNPIGLIPMLISILIGLPMELGLLGPLWITLAPIVTAIIAFLLVPVVKCLFGSKKIANN